MRNLYFSLPFFYTCLLEDVGICFLCMSVFLLCLTLCVCVYAHIPVDELISPKDIDPIHRYVPRQDQRNVSMRYSNQVSWNVTVIDCHFLALILNSTHVLHNLSSWILICTTEIHFENSFGFKCSLLSCTHPCKYDLTTFKCFWPEVMTRYTH